ncbi:hypothetical protein [Paractinoplanes toevensis]|uniref:Uncharacterized protein n=1 Tax=Paractinoplanes toevensis TaxID=571911 RepID=A0A919T776_9ACTN|nr:hypothetical protein [Actinoplanes toevensis]GIM88841.1 hypothetical protein Ato02nite_006340 [Actinoplanes toevensis]
MATLADLHEWRVTFTMGAGSARRAFVVQIPAVDEEHARKGAFGLALAINDAAGHVWKIGDEAVIERVAA